jgi:hypothetical protein
MAVAFLIDGVASSVKAGSFNFSRRTGEGDTGSFISRSSEGVRQVGQRFEAFDSWGVKVFSGPIDSVSLRRVGATGNTDVWYECTVVSWGVRLSRRVCGAQLYTTGKTGHVVTDLLNRYAPDDGVSIGLGLVEDGIDVPAPMSFIGKTLAEAYNELAQLNPGFIWYVRPDGELYFGPNDGVASGLTFHNANNNFHDPVIEEDAVDYLNRVHLAVSWEAFAPIEDTVTGDGSATEFTLADVGGEDAAVDNIKSIELAGIPQTYGVEGSDTSAQWLYNFGTNIIKAGPGTIAPLGSGDSLVIKYYPVGGNIITRSATADIAARAAIEDTPTAPASGVYEAFFEDLSITALDAATARADGILAARNPFTNGAPAGTMPRKYTFRARGYMANADKIQPGMVVTYSNTVPSTGGAINLMIESIEAQHVGAKDPSDGGSTGGWLQYTVKATRYTKSITPLDFFRALSGQAVTAGGSLGSLGNGNTVTPSPEAAPAGNITDPQSKAYYQEDKLITEHRYTPPVPVGTFAGVHLYAELVNQSGSGNPFTVGETPLDGTAALEGEWKPVEGPRKDYIADEPIIWEWPEKVTEPTQARIYFASFNSSGKENELVRAGQSGETPSVLITLYPPPSGVVGAEYADNVIAFNATVNEYMAGAVLRDRITCTFDWPEQRKPAGLYIYAEHPQLGEGRYALGIISGSGQSVELNAPTKTLTGALIWAVGFIDANNTPEPEDDAVNTIVEGVTPVDVVTLGELSGVLDLGEAIAASVAPYISIVNKVLGIYDQGITEELIGVFEVSQSRLENAQIIDAARIVDAAVENSKLGSLSVSTPKIADFQVVAAKIDALAVTTTKVDNAAITNAKVGFLAVGNTNIQDSAIQTAKIQDASIVTVKIQNGAITNALIGNLAVATANIQDLAVIGAKIANMEVGKLLAGTLTVAVEFTALQMQLNLNGATVKIRNDVAGEGSGTYGMTLKRNSDFLETRIVPGEINLYSPSGGSRVSVRSYSGYGVVDVDDNTGTTAIEMTGGPGTFGGIYLYGDRNIIFSYPGSGYLQINALRHNAILATGAPGGSPTAGKFPVYNPAGGLVGYVYLYSS